MSEKQKASSRKPVTSGLTALPVGGSDTWPVCQIDSVTSSIYRLGIKKSYKYSFAIDKEQGVITVTRTA